MLDFDMKIGLFLVKVMIITHVHRRTRRGIRGIPGYPVGLKMAGYPSDLNPMVKKMGRKKFMLPKGKEKEVKEREKEREQERKMKIYSVKNMEYTVEMAKN